MSSPQASTLSDGGEPREDPLEQGTPYDERKFVRKLLESCSNRQEEKYKFEDHVVQKGVTFGETRCPMGLTRGYLA